MLTHIHSEDFIRATVAEFLRCTESNLLRAHEEDNRFYNTNHEFRPSHTDQAFLSFLEEMSTGKCVTDGSQGSIVSWAYCGNYICVVDFVEYMRSFVTALFEKLEYSCVSMFFQYSDSQSRLVQLDKSNAVKKFEREDERYEGRIKELPFSFDETTQWGPKI